MFIALHLNLHTDSSVSPPSKVIALKDKQNVHEFSRVIFLCMLASPHTFAFLVLELARTLQISEKSSL